MSHILVVNHNFVTQLFFSILNASDLPELAWVLLSELPRIDHYIAFSVLFFIISDKEVRVCLDERILWLLFSDQVQLSNLIAVAAK